MGAQGIRERRCTLAFLQEGLMWRCEWCGAEFDEPLHEPAGTFLGNLMVHDVCPECGNDDIEELEDNDV